MNNAKVWAPVFIAAILLSTGGSAQAQIIKCTTADGRTIYGDANACEGTDGASVISTHDKVSAVKRQNALSQSKKPAETAKNSANQTAYERSAKPETFEKPHIEHLNPAVQRLTPRKIFERKKQRLSDFYEQE